MTPIRTSSPSALAKRPPRLNVAAVAAEFFSSDLREVAMARSSLAPGSMAGFIVMRLAVFGDRTGMSTRVVCRTANVFIQRITNARQDAGPSACLVLTKQTRSRVPRTILAIEQPAPVGDERQQYPHWFCQRTGEVGHAGVDGDNKVQIRNQRRRVG